MANPHGPVTTGTTTTGTPPIPPLDPEQVREIQLLAEAALVSFTATPDALTPFGRATLAWEIRMPTTLIPGVHPEVHLYGVGDQVVDPKGSQVVAPYGDTTYAVSLRTPLATRQMGTLDLAVDFGACTGVVTLPGAFTAIIKGEADRSFPGGGKVTLRGGGSSVDIGDDSFVVDIPLRASLPNWFDADIDVSVGFSLSSLNGQFNVTCDFARTEVSFGAATAVLTAGCSAAVAAALEAQSDGFLSGFVGPVVAERISAAIAANVHDNLVRLDQEGPPPVPYQLYDVALTVDGLTYRFCPAHPAPPGPPHHPPGGGIDPFHL